MSDYTPATDFSVKDGLSTGNPSKLIKGSEFDTEFDAISTAIATKYDSNDLASQAEAEAESSTTKLMTPGRVAQWADYNAGMVGDIQALADPNADRLLGWDDSAGAAIGYALGTGLTTSTTTVLVNESALTIANMSDVATRGVDHSGVSVITASAGLAAVNNDLTSNIGLSIDVSSMGTSMTATSFADLDTDLLIIDDGGTDKKTVVATILTPEVPSAVTGTTDTLAETDFGKLTNYSSTSTVTITLPDGLKTGFWAVLRKTGASGTINLSASTTYQARGGLSSITAQYGVVTVFHLGSNVWTAWGDLT